MVTTTMTMRMDVAIPHCCDLLNASHCSYVYLTIAFMHCHKSPLYVRTLRRDKLTTMGKK